MPLTNAVSNSSNRIILKSFDEIVKTHLSQQRWINARNYYLKDTRGRVNAISNINQIKKKPMAEYIASSAILHCYDGWNYISRASESLLNGDISSAIHLIYYSELRSVMSLMAYEGIGIFDHRHIWFDANEDPHFTPGRITTHQAADGCIKEWSKLTNKKEVVFNFIKIKNRKLNDWIDATQFTSKSKYSSMIAQEWLEKWSIDLRLTDDQILRNEMSYRPHFEIKEIKIRDAALNLVAIWKGLEPSGANRFSNLDNHLYRIAIEKVYSKWKGKKATGPDFNKFVNKMFDNIGEPKTQLLYDFLLRLTEPDDHFIITEAKKDLYDNRLNLTNPFPMFCRAILMLRMATGASSQLINTSSLAQQNIKYWWEGICRGIGIFNATETAADASELFMDVSDSINSIESSATAVLGTLKDAIPSISSDLSTIKQFQRVCFWGMGL
jgi:hypothetical protein